MTPVRLEPAALPSRVKHFTTEPLRSQVINVRYINCSYNNVAKGICLLDKKAFFCLNRKEIMQVRAFKRYIPLINKQSQYFISTCVGFNKCIDIFFLNCFSIIHYSLKSDYSLFINFFFYSLKIIGLFIIFRPSLFTIHYFFGSLFTIHYKKGHNSLIIIPHPDPHNCSLSRIVTLTFVIVIRYNTLI